MYRFNREKDYKLCYYPGKWTHCILNSFGESENEKFPGNNLLESGNNTDQQWDAPILNSAIPGISRWWLWTENELLWVGAKKYSLSQMFVYYGLLGDEATFHKNHYLNYHNFQLHSTKILMWWPLLLKQNDL